MLRTIVDATRRNHALEHGTVTLMLGRSATPLRLVGRATGDGFFIYGRVPTALLEGCARDALARLQRGEASLALTPLCGTNIAVGAILTGVASMLAMGERRRWENLPNVVIAAMVSVSATQPLGRWVQQRLTTRPDLEGVRIVGVRRGLGGWLHKVETAADRTSHAS